MLKLSEGSEKTITEVQKLAEKKAKRKIVVIDEESRGFATHETEEVLASTAEKPKKKKLKKIPTKIKTKRHGLLKKKDGEKEEDKVDKDNATLSELAKPSRRMKRIRKATSKPPSVSTCEAMAEHAVKYQEKKEKQYKEADAAKGLSKEVWMVENEIAKKKEVNAWGKEGNRKKDLKKLKHYKKRKIMAEEIAAPSLPLIVEPATKTPTIVDQEGNKEMMAEMVSAPEFAFPRETQPENSFDDSLVLTKVVEDVRGSLSYQDSPLIRGLTESATRGRSKGRKRMKILRKFLIRKI